MITIINLVDNENVEFDASLVMQIIKTNIPPRKIRNSTPSRYID